MTVENGVTKLSVFEDAEKITEIFRQAVNQALLMHKRAGNPIAISRNGEIVIIPPEEIPVDDPLAKQ